MAAGDPTAAAAAGDGVVVGDAAASSAARPTLRQRAHARGYTKYGIWGFESAAQYFTSLKATGMLAGARALYVRHPADALADREGNELKRTLNGFSVAALGTGMIVGSGIFVSTGVAAKTFAGPAVILSMAIAGLCALLSCLIYAEFSSGWPVAGGSYTFVSLTLGELAAFLVITTLVFEYVLANAAVARTFTAYLEQLVSPKNGPQVVLTIPWKGLNVDFVAFGLVVVLTALISLSTRGADLFNTVCTGAQMLVIVVMIIAGFVKANPANLQPFAPNGVRGVFNGASLVFFSFIGFDAVSTLSEETKKPER
jgi:APA family basic amino acid/polyamine antiporter